MIRTMLARAALLAALVAAGCSGPAPRAETPQQVVAWKTVGSWSGRGNRQTESFRSDSGALRVRWTSSLVSREPGANGALRVTAHSAISGRLLEQVVDHRGDGKGVGYVNQDPHVFYLMVESDHVDWTLSVEEAVAGTVAGSGK
jgi:hypothetical protein